MNNLIDIDENFTVETKTRLAPGEMEEVGKFLSGMGLSLEEELDETVIVRDAGKIIATGSASGCVIKCMAVNPEIRGKNLSGVVAGKLLQDLYHRGKSDIFVFTKPENRDVFENLGFFEIYEAKGDALLMENNPSGFASYIENIKKETPPGLRELAGKGAKICAVVVNCNPFTRGHLYLMEKAASECDLLYIFVVSEDKSLFPSEVRYNLVKKGTSHLENVSVHRGGSYIISASTFPSYFIKEGKKVLEVHARMDAGIFAERIAPLLGIKKRYAGEEPLCPVTENYNRVMGEVLPAAGVEFEVIKRVETGGDVISASRVRKLIACGRLSEAKELLPGVTIEYLESGEAEEVIKKIKGMVK